MTKDIGRDAVLAALAERAPKSIHLMEVVHALGLPKAERDAVRDALDELTALGMAREMPGNRFRIATRKRRAPEEARAPAVSVTGWLSIHPRGFGFVAAEDGGSDVFIAGGQLNHALHGDRVRVDARRSAKGRDGTVVEVVRRGVGRVAGVLQRDHTGTWLERSDPRGPARVEVVGTVPLGIEAGAEVVAQIAKWPDRDGEPMQARVLATLGVKGSAAVEIEKLKIREGIVEEFDESVIAAAQAFGTCVTERDLTGREDLRGIDLVTIDPPTARDHDDAVWAERLDDGAFRVIIAIADVSHYVAEGSALDHAALDRCMSIYLPDRVIPMLPHELSSNLASLVPDEDRLCLAVEVELGPRGAVRAHRFIEGVMRSRGRISYGGAARALGLTDAPECQPVAEAHRALLSTLWDVSKALRRKRRRRGGLDFALPEAEVVLDAGGEPTDVRRSRTDPGLRQAYGMIEDLMLLANEVVAADLARRRVPAIYRVHGPPDERKVEAFAALAESLGYALDGEITEPKAIASFLREVEGSEHAQALSFLLLRSMQQATYDTTNIGHFALAARHYLHFTSPIRRYPDLAVHRVVRAIARRDRVDKEGLAQRFGAQAAAASRLERRGLLVDREATDVYRAILVAERIGERFEAQITAVTEHCLYVAFDDPFVEARVPIDTLGADWYELDAMGLRLVGARSGHAYALGDRLTVQLRNVSVAGREVTAEPVHAVEPRRPKRAPKRGDHRRRETSPKGQRGRGGPRPSKKRRRQG